MGAGLRLVVSRYPLIDKGISRAALKKVSKSNAEALLRSFYLAQNDITTAVKKGEHVAEYGAILNSTKVIETQAKEAFGEEWLVGLKKASVTNENLFTKFPNINATLNEGEKTK